MSRDTKTNLALASVLDAATGGADALKAKTILAHAGYALWKDSAALLAVYADVEKVLGKEFAKWKKDVKHIADAIKAGAVEKAREQLTSSTPKAGEVISSVTGDSGVANTSGELRQMVIAFNREMDRQQLVVDACGSFRHASGALSSLTAIAVCTDAAFYMRAKGDEVAISRLQETADSLIRAMAKIRRRVILDKFLNKPSKIEGVYELRKWLIAVTGEDREADVAAMMHWIWLVKTKQAGRQGDMHIMINLFGRQQKSGKTTAVRKLVAGWEELADLGFDAATLCDEKSVPALTNKAIGFLDELHGLAKADTAKLKSTITAQESGYRPMRSNERALVAMRMTFIGTSNTTIRDLVRDPTGARRFYELSVPKKCDWEAINAVDYDLLWQCVNEDERAPGLEYEDLISAPQQSLVHKDIFETWLEAEAFVVSGGEVLDPYSGVKLDDIYILFTHFCHSGGEKVPTREVFGRGLQALGWRVERRRGGSEKIRIYYRPSDDK